MQPKKGTKKRMMICNAVHHTKQLGLFIHRFKDTHIYIHSYSLRLSPPSPISFSLLFMWDFILVPLWPSAHGPRVEKCCNRRCKRSYWLRWSAVASHMERKSWTAGLSTKRTYNITFECLPKYASQKFTLVSCMLEKVCVGWGDWCFL